MPRGMEMDVAASSAAWAFEDDARMRNRWW